MRLDHGLPGHVLLCTILNDPRGLTLNIVMDVRARFWCAAFGL